MGFRNVRQVVLACLVVLMQAWIAAPAYAQAAPTISSVTPNTSSVNGGTTIVITGTNFVNVSRVYFSGSNNVDVASYTVNSSTQITAVTAAFSPMNIGRGAIVVDTATGSGSLYGFEVLPALTITNVSPASGAAAGGTQVQIQGTGFQDALSNSVITAVKFGGVAASSVQVQNGNFISVATPAGTAGTTVDIEITRSNGDVATVPNGFTYLAPLPTVTSVSPASGSTNGGTSVVITGTNFVNVTGVEFSLNGGGTMAATSFVVNSPTQITAVTPSVGGSGDSSYVGVRTLPRLRL